MAEVVNLNRYRKAKAKVVGQEQANINRIVFGRSRPEKEELRKALEKVRLDLNGKKLED